MDTKLRNFLMNTFRLDKETAEKWVLTCTMAEAMGVLPRVMVWLLNR